MSRFLTFSWLEGRFNINIYFRGAQNFAQVESLALRQFPISLIDQSRHCAEALRILTCVVGMQRWYTSQQVRVIAILGITLKLIS